MEKIKKCIPDKIVIAGRKVVINEKDFDNMVKTINTQTKVINELIDKVKDIDNLKKSVKILANAVQTTLED